MEAEERKYVRLTVTPVEERRQVHRGEEGKQEIRPPQWGPGAT